MLTFLTVVHLLVAVVLILFVLLQDPKGGGAMGVFGGGSSSTSVFGSTGAGNVLTSVTKGAAILFALSCIGLTYLISNSSQSVVDSLPVAAPVESMTPPVETAPESTSATDAPAAEPSETK